MIVRSKPKSRDRERGQVLVWTLVLLPLLLALLGLVFDGGLLWVHFRKARWAADGAAVAAASEMDALEFRKTGKVVLGEEALTTAEHYARMNDEQLHITGVQVIDNVVYVRGWVTVEPVFLKVVGVGDVTFQIRGEERPAWGASVEER